MVYRETGWRPWQYVVAQIERRCIGLCVSECWSVGCGISLSSRVMKIESVRWLARWNVIVCGQEANRAYHASLFGDFG